jgi:predicted DCC family thiol-disulfide oxidoreductase YuxK
MRNLTVLYDSKCGLCRRARTWLENEPKLVDLVFVPAASPEAQRLYPSIDPAATLVDMTVVSDEGEVYMGAKAWLMCLWALREYREWSLSLATPQLLPMARKIVEAVSQNRRRLGALRFLLTDIG